MDQRLTVLEAVVSCDRCPLSSSTDPVAFTGPSPAEIVIVGDNPSLPDSECGQLGRGQSGELLRRLLGEAGIDVDSVGWMNTISCFTPDTPTAESVSACTPNRLAILDLFEPKWVILLGEVALQAIRSDLKIANARGMPFRHPAAYEAVFFPIYHPAYALRQKAGELQMREDLKTFTQMVNAKDLAPYVSDHCGRCGEEAIYWESTMVPWGQCGSSSCGLPAAVSARLAEVFAESDGLSCREAGCSAPASRHPISFPTGTVPDQMSWNALSSDCQVLMQMVYTGGDRGVTESALRSHSKKRSAVAIGADLQRLSTLGWLLSPDEFRDTWVLSPRGRAAMEAA